MKRAFTLLEIVLTVIVIGIISSIMVPRLTDTSLHKAAEQIMFHLRYTQHLALTENHFNPDDRYWYKSRWQLYFSYCRGDNDQCGYTVFSDRLNDHRGNPDPPEIAINPLNPSQFLTGGSPGNKLIHYDDKEATKSMNLGRTYGIKKVSVKNCGRAKRIAFDYIGRPIVGNMRTMKSVYQKKRLLDKKCMITLIKDKSEKATIVIEPESGYVYLL